MLDVDTGEDYQSPVPARNLYFLILQAPFQVFPLFPREQRFGSKVFEVLVSVYITLR